MISGAPVTCGAWQARTSYRQCEPTDLLVQEWWRYVEEQEQMGYESIRSLFQWCTGYPSLPHCNWTFQLCFTDDDLSRLPKACFCTTESPEGGSKMPTLFMPRYRDRWEIEADDGSWQVVAQAIRAPECAEDVADTSTEFEGLDGIRYAMRFVSVDEATAEEWEESEDESADESGDESSGELKAPKTPESDEAAFATPKPPPRRMRRVLNSAQQVMREKLAWAPAGNHMDDE